MLLTMLLLLLGFAILIKGADWLVAGASSLARRRGISELAIGLTIVAFGTSAPELVVNTVAALQDQDAIVLANIIGSNNFNLFVILGISGLIAPLAVQSSTVYREIPISLLATAMLFLLAGAWLAPGQAEISRLDGLVLLVLFVAFLAYVYFQLRGDTPGAEDRSSATRPAWPSAGLIGLGLGGLVLGGRLVVLHAVSLASTLGMSEQLIGLTIVAMGTSLPELATSVVAALRKNNDIAVGNIIDSNIFNIFLILGLSATLSPVTYDQAFNTDLALLSGGTLLLFFAMFTGERHRLDRWEALLLLLTYVVYLVLLIRSSV
jgi:cation:H+ antiporter